MKHCSVFIYTILDEVEPSYQPSIRLAQNTTQLWQTLCGGLDLGIPLPWKCLSRAFVQPGLVRMVTVVGVSQ